MGHSSETVSVFLGNDRLRQTGDGVTGTAALAMMLLPAAVFLLATLGFLTAPFFFLSFAFNTFSIAAFPLDAVPFTAFRFNSVPLPTLAVSFPGFTFVFACFALAFVVQSLPFHEHAPVLLPFLLPALVLALLFAAPVIRSLFPVRFAEAPGFVYPNPTIRNKHITGAFVYPSAGSPRVAVPIPLPVTWPPDVTGTWCWPGFVARWWWRV